jgi:hypothetical protein
LPKAPAVLQTEFCQFPFLLLLSFLPIFSLESVLSHHPPKKGRCPLELAWWCTAVIPALRKLRQEDCEFKAILDYSNILSGEKKKRFV